MSDAAPPISSLKAWRVGHNNDGEMCVLIMLRDKEEVRAWATWLADKAPWLDLLPPVGADVDTTDGNG